MKKKAPNAAHKHLKELQATVVQNGKQKPKGTKVDIAHASVTHFPQERAVKFLTALREKVKQPESHGSFGLL
jgi:hypothetical protein